MHDSINNIRYESLDRWRMDMGFEVERPLHGYESEQVEALHQLLSSANLLQDRDELKIWNSCPYGNFTVKELFFFDWQNWIQWCLFFPDKGLDIYSSIQKYILLFGWRFKAEYVPELSKVKRVWYQWSFWYVLYVQLICKQQGIYWFIAHLQGDYGLSLWHGVFLNH